MSSYKPPFARMNNIHAAIQGRNVPDAPEVAPAANVMEAIQNLQTPVDLAPVVEEIHVEHVEDLEEIHEDSFEEIHEEQPPEHVEEPPVTVPPVDAAPEAPKVDDKPAPEAEGTGKKPEKPKKHKA